MAKKTKEEWKKELTPEQYSVMFEQGTEAPGTGTLLHNKGSGVYICGACGMELFSSGAKFDSGSGWPSFTSPVTNSAVELHEDTSLGMSRTEVICSNCGAHLGHVFDDGPAPTGKRFCVNSISLHLK